MDKMRRATFEALSVYLNEQIPDRWAEYPLQHWEWQYLNKRLRAIFDPADKALANIIRKLEKLRAKEEREARKINDNVNQYLAKIGPDGRRRARRRRTVPRIT